MKSQKKSVVENFKLEYYPLTFTGNSGTMYSMKKTAKTPFSEKKRVSIFLTSEKERELKKNAIDNGMSLSEYLETVGTITNTSKASKTFETQGAATVEAAK